MRWRHGVLALLAVLPLLVYWPTVFHRYGFRDDYSVLRESHEEPNKVMQVGAMQARPLYGVLLEASFRHSRTIRQLADLRFGSALLLGGVAAAFYVTLRKLKWDPVTASLAAALLVVIPSAQILVSWAVAWPRGVALLLAIAGFDAAEMAFARVKRARMLCWPLGLILVATSALVYPPDTLVYLTLVTAGLWSKRRWSMRHVLEWLVRHAVTVAIGLGIAFTTMVVMFAHREVAPSSRIAFEGHWMEKLLWFAEEPLQNALGLIVLNHDGGVALVHRVAALVAVLIVAGLLEGCLRRGGHRGWWKLPVVLVLLLGSFGVNLVAADHWPVYRVLLPLTMTGAVALTLALFHLGGRTAARWALLALVIPGVWLARRQTFGLIAAPQAVELATLEAGARQVDPTRHPSVFILTPAPEQRVAQFASWDEFGSLSTDSDWTPKEMLKLVLRERFPRLPEVDRQCTVRTGRAVPFGLRPDVVIDLQNMRSGS